MFSALKKSLLEMKRGKPGKRFREHYAAEHRRGYTASVGMRLFRLGLAIIALIIAVILVFMPGPAVVFFALAGALLAPESLLLAKGLDWAELKIRPIVAWMIRTWQKMGWLGRSVTGALAAIMAACMGMVAWYRFVD